MSSQKPPDDLPARIGRLRAKVLGPALGGVSSPEGDPPGAAVGPSPGVLEQTTDTLALDDMPSTDTLLPDWVNPTVVERGRQREPPPAEMEPEPGAYTQPETRPSALRPRPEQMDEMQTRVWDSAEPRRPEERVDPTKVIGERYQIISGLADGGMARIYKVLHLGLGKEFALKIIQSQIAAEPQIRQRFFREAQVSSRMDHPNIVQVTDFGVDSRFGAYIVMEYLKGETLHARLRRESRLRVPLSLDVALQIAEALHFMHGEGIIHCDIKAENIFLCRAPAEQRQRSTVKLIDFGLSRNQALGATLAKSEVGGTPQYVAPEQIRGLAPQPSMDIYSLGVLLYGMVTGRLPFSGSTKELLTAHLYQAPQRPAELVKEPLDERVEQFILQALSKDPAERQPTMGQVIFELRTLMEMLGLRAPRRGKSEVRPVGPDDHLRPVFEFCPCPLFRVDAEARIQVANPAFCQFVRMSPEELQGTSIDSTRLGNVYPEVRREIQAAARAGTRSPVDRIVRFPKGPDQEVQILIRLVPEPGDGGAITHFIGVIHPLAAV